MTTQTRADLTRRTAFGEVAQLYDASRPGSADAVIADVLAYAAAG